MKKQPQINPRFNCNNPEVCGETAFARLNKGWAFIGKMTAEDYKAGKALCVGEFKADFSKACEKYINYLY
jgi:hypothetical protein